MPVVDFSLAGKVALVTGASRGIGEAIARGFAEQGATVIIASRKQESLDPVAESINNAGGGSCVPIACHTGDADAIAKLFERIKNDYGQLDILVNNAATNPYFGPIVETDMGAFDKTMEVNIKGYFLMSQYAGRLMVEQGGGSIINVASIAGLTPGHMQGIYSMSKAAVINMTKAFAKELGSANVRVNCICPGVVETKFSSVLLNTPEIYDQFIQMIPMGRHGQPNEIAGLAVYLASPASTFTTGSIIVADGGMEA